MSKRAMGRPVCLFEIANVLQVSAEEMGLPPREFPQRIRMRDEHNVPRWFTLEGFEGSDAIYSGDGELRLIITGHSGDRS